MTAGFSGLPALSAGDQEQTFGAIKRLTPISLALVLLLFRIVEKRPGGMLSVALVLVLSIGAALGVVGFLTGKLTVMETLFGVTVFGLGIDFAVHLFVRQREELAHRRPFDLAVRRTLSRRRPRRRRRLHHDGGGVSCRGDRAGSGGAPSRPVGRPGTAVLPAAHAAHPSFRVGAAATAASRAGGRRVRGTGWAGDAGPRSWSPFRRSVGDGAAGRVSAREWRIARGGSRGVAPAAGRDAA